MIRFMGHLFGLMGAVVMTLLATYALIAFGPQVRTPNWGICLCFEVKPYSPTDDATLARLLPPVRLVQPAAPSRIKPPTILCEVPDDPMSVTDCDGPLAERSGTL